MSPQYFLVLAVIIVMGWFAAGVIYNLRHGNAILRWMQGGLPMIAEKTTLRWLGTSVAELGLVNPKRPFRQMTLMVVLAPRDVPWFWAMAALQARKDLVIFRSQLASAPKVSFELVNPSSWTGRLAVRDCQRKGWENEPYQGLRLLAPAGKMEQARKSLPGIEKAVQPFGAPVRLAVSSTLPHLEIHLPPPDTRRQDAHQYFRSLQELAVAAME